MSLAGFLPNKPTLVDVPTSNHGARVRFLIYAKGLKHKFDIKTPKEAVGGLGTPEFLALHPYRKMPVLVLPDGQAIPESEVIYGYILDAYRGMGPDFTADTPEKRAKSSWISRSHDTYLSPNLGAMYAEMGIEDRAEKVEKIRDFLDLLEVQVDGPFMVGDSFSGADATMFPTFTFMNFMLTTFFGWKSIFTGRPKLEAWWEEVRANADAAEVIGEMENALTGWGKSGWWEDKGIIEQVKDTSYTWSY